VTVATKDTVEAAAAPASTAKNGAEPSQFLTRDAILAAVDIVTETVDVPEWGGKVLVKGLTGQQRDAFERTMTEQRGKKVETNLANFRAKLVVWSVVDEGGNRLFSAADAEALGRKSAAALQRVFEVASRLSGLSVEDVEELTEVLKDNPSGDSGSD
jgi:hypothetical protein